MPEAVPAVPGPGRRGHGIRRPALVCAILILTVGCRERRRPDILLITIDTLRADRLGVYGSRLGLTPNIDSLAIGALVFDRAYAVAPITGPSLSSAFTSHYPHETKITDNGLLIPTGVVTLAELLRRDGYRGRAEQHPSGQSGPTVTGKVATRYGAEVWAVGLGAADVARSAKT